MGERLAGGSATTNTPLPASQPPVGGVPSPEPLAPEVQLQQMIAGYVLSQAVYVAAKLGVADLLVDGRLSTHEIAQHTGADEATLYRFLRALAAVEVFHDDGRGRFGLGRLGASLRSDASGSLRAYAIHANEECYRAWGEALHSARTGQAGFEAAFGTSFYAYMADKPEANAIWNQAMTETERAWTVDPGLPQSYDWQDGSTVIDVGGGQGALIAAILAAAPSLDGILFDLPHVVDGAHQHLKAAGVDGRCQVVGGDAFEGVPAGGDVYVLSRVLFNWDDEKAAALLRRCREAMADQGRVLIIEPVITGGPGDMAALIDLNVFITCGGRTRTGAELDALLARAGLAFRRVVPAPSAWNIIEAAAS